MARAVPEDSAELMKKLRPCLQVCGLWPVFMGMWLIGLLAQMVGWILGADGDDLQRIFRDSMPWALIGWPFAIGYAVALVLVAIGAVGWLAGSFAAGFNEPREK